MAVSRDGPVDAPVAMGGGAPSCFAACSVTIISIKVKLNIHTTFIGLITCYKTCMCHY